MANLTVRLHDDGGGLDTSAPETFKITVTEVNDAPTANDDTATDGRGHDRGRDRRPDR